MHLSAKLAVLADAAKYDASCASSGTERRDASDGRGLGSTEGSGICHSYAPDGSCISLLKILLTNFCAYDCLYCVTRVSSNVPRARFAIDEVVRLTLELDVDPRLAWALAHRERFPVDFNRAPRGLLLRVPGLGVRTVDRLLAARRVRRVRAEDLRRLRLPLAKLLPFVVVDGHRPMRTLDATDLAARLRPAPEQASLFDDAAARA